MFTAIYAFFSETFKLVTDGNWSLSQIYEKGILNMIFAAIYLFLLVMVLILSLAMPLEKGKGYFMVVTVAFSALSISAIVGIIFYFL